MTNLTYDETLDYATSAHAGQTRWNGDAYITHPIAVAEFLPDHEGKIVALLHDVVEDTTITLDDLLANGFSHEIVNAVDAISKRYIGEVYWEDELVSETDDYWEYLAVVKTNEIARRVKIADVSYNLISLMTDYPHKVKKIEKYKKALNFLI